MKINQMKKDELFERVLSDGSQRNPDRPELGKTTSPSLSKMTWVIEGKCGMPAHNGRIYSEVTAKVASLPQVNQLTACQSR